MIRPLGNSFANPHRYLLPPVAAIALVMFLGVWGNDAVAQQKNSYLCKHGVDTSLSNCPACVPVGNECASAKAALRAAAQALS